MAPTTGLHLKGHQYLRQRIILSLLSGKSVFIDDIRANQQELGLSQAEISFLKLIESLTNGTRVDINYTGTSVAFMPGIIIGGNIIHDCGTERSIGYFLQPLISLAPFSKLPFSINLLGITNGSDDLSADFLRVSTVPLLKKFGIDGATLKIKKRGAFPNGGGEVHFFCPSVKTIQPINLCDEGHIKRIRGIAYSTRVSPQTSNRMIESARSLLNKFIPDVYIHSDVYKGIEGGKSPGYGITLIAESTSGAILSSERTANGGELPEEVGLDVAKLLFEQIHLGGFIDVQNQCLVFTLMAVSTEDVGKIITGKLSPNSIQMLRDIKEFFGLVFNIKSQAQDRYLVSCLGTGYMNFSKKTT